MQNEPKIILLIVPSRAFDRGLLRGIARYANEHGPWTFFREPPHYRQIGWKQKVSNRLAKGNVDGIIMREPERIEDILKINIPGICAPVTKWTVDGMINIVTDNEEVGRMGAEHLLDRGFRHFAFCGLGGIYWSQKRSQAFEARIAEAGYTTSVYQQPTARDVQVLWEKEEPYLAKWLKSLPKPVGLMTCNDDRGQDVIDTCHSEGQHVPGEVAVIGVDNDEFVCELTNPQLSSICLNPEATGYNAAAILDQMMSGKEVKDTTIIGSPMYAVTRKSTDIMLIEDQMVVKAMCYIRQNSQKPIQVADVADLLIISRRSLEQKFRKVVGRTVHEEIQFARVDRITRLLVETNLSISQIAHVLNFSSTKQLDRVFIRHSGMTPSEYRRKHCVN